MRARFLGGRALCPNHLCAVGANFPIYIVRYFMRPVLFAPRAVRDRCSLVVPGTAK